MNLATRIFARTAVVALLAVSAAFFAGCGKKDEGGNSADKKEAAEKGKEDLQKGLESLKAGKAEDAVKSFEKAANDGNSTAMVYLSLCYDTGKGVEENEEESKKLVKKSADAGNVMGKFAAVMNEVQDQKIKPDEAFKKLKELDADLLKLAEANDPLAQSLYLILSSMKSQMEETPEAKLKAAEDVKKWSEKIKESGADKLFD